MDDTFRSACCPSTPSGYIRGANGYPEGIAGAGTATQARHAAVERGALARGSGATCWSYWRFYFRFFPGSIKSPQVVQFLKALHRTIGKKLLIVWDRLQAHRSRLVQAYLETLNGHIALEYLPAYAPELNPVEYIWGYLKHHAMPNFCARDLGVCSIAPADICARCNAARPWSLRSGNRQNCSEFVMYFWKTQ